MENYTVRINRAVDYITENLSEEINLEDIANVVEISKYHFHKIFKSVIGETPSEFIKRLRLEKSAGMLICTDKSMIIIAIEYGFSSSSVFSREFKKKYLLSPRDFRTFFQFYNSNNKYDSFSFEEKIKSNQNISEIMRISKHIIFNRDMAFKIETLPEYKVIYMRTIGEYTDYSSIHSLWMKLKEFAVANSLYDKNIKLFSLIHDNPNICIKGKCRYDACFSISSDKDIKILKNKIGITVISGGKYAVFDFKGSMNNIMQAYTWIDRTWFKENGYEPENKPPYFKHLEVGNSPEHFEFKICVPIKKI